ncbi:FAD-dependent oxidoreductase [Nocardia sp. NPDC050630]|uniref:FAD-dependent oxidoreductase n=1 Tax=Nocardia sp. NPDC050630 TaxID=3364321 RepID=UPI0037B1AD08
MGSGPSGCFTAQALRKRMPQVRITVFDSLPTPYGLIRHGIAPDHQGAKAVHRQFDRLFAQDGIRFVGNTVIGEDLPMTVLSETFDAVVLATGLSQDRGLGVPQDPAARVLGAGSLLRLLNSDPDAALRHRGDGVPDLGEEVAVIGTGNVAVDVARLLTKSSAELLSSDIDDAAREALLPGRIKAIHIIGRSRREDAKWEPAMIHELASVQSVDLRFDGKPFDPDANRGEGSVLVDVRFEQVLHSITTDGNRTRVATHERINPSKPQHYTVDTVISAVGFEDASPLGEQFDQSSNVFRVGGSASGRLGNLAENRKLATAAAQTLADYLMRKRPLPGPDALESLLPANHVTFEGWKRIEEAETRRARPGRCRTKFTTRDELLAAAESRDTP